MSERPRQGLRNTLIRLKEKVSVFGAIRSHLHLSRIGTVLVVLMGFFVAFALWAPYFKLKQINVMRTDATFDTRAVEVALSELKGRNLLFLTKSDVETLLFDAFPTFREVQMQELWPDGIDLQIIVAPAAVLVQNQGDGAMTVITDDGIVIRPHTEEVLPIWTLRQHEKPLERGSRLFSVEEMQFVADAQQLLKSQVGLTPDAVTVLWAAGELHLSAEGGRIMLWFDLGGDLLDQLDRLITSAEEIELSTRAFDHIDLRVPEHIYWQWSR